MITQKEATVAEVEFDDYTLRCTGFLDEDEWEFTMTIKNSPYSPSVYTVVEDCYDDDDVESMVWGEVLRIAKKYSVVIVSKEDVDVEEDDDDE